MSALTKTTHSASVSGAIIATKGFDGVIQGATLPDLIQMECLSMSTRAVRVDRGDIAGRIFFAGGQTVHAELGDLLGEEALFEMLRWENGAFTIEEGVRSMDDTINRDWHGLVIEAAHRADHSGEHSTTHLRPTRMIKDSVSETFKDPEILTGVQFNPEGDLLQAKGDEGEQTQATFAYVLELVRLIGNSLGAENLRELQISCQQHRAFCVIRDNDTVAVVGTPKLNFNTVVKSLQ